MQFLLAEVTRSLKFGSIMMDADNSRTISKRAALVIAHPGHELRVHHWLEEAKPLVFVLTDGSGRTTQSRLASTSKILQQAGATPGSIYGRFTDAAIYKAMLEGQCEALLPVLEELTEALVAGEIDYVAGDALEGYNTSHDLCRYLIGAAVELAQRRSKREIGNYDFLLTGPPDECPADLRANAVKLSLDEAAVERKLAAAQNYPELLHEVNGALQQFGKAPFSMEWLRPVSNHVGLNPASTEVPYYESYGEKQKAAGHYKYVIRLREHMLPLAQMMWNYVGQTS
jgi:AcrR family transcriptional regulator